MPDQGRLLGLLRGEERDELGMERLEHDATFKLEELMTILEITLGKGVVPSFRGYLAVALL